MKQLASMELDWIDLCAFNNETAGKGTMAPEENDLNEEPSGAEMPMHIGLAANLCPPHLV